MTYDMLCGWKGRDQSLRLEIAVLELVGLARLLVGSMSDLLVAVYVPALPSDSSAADL